MTAHWQLCLTYGVDDCDIKKLHPVESWGGDDVVIEKISMHPHDKSRHDGGCQDIMYWSIYPRWLFQIGRWYYPNHMGCIILISHLPGSLATKQDFMVHVTGVFFYCSNRTQEVVDLTKTTLYANRGALRWETCYPALLAWPFFLKEKVGLRKQKNMTSWNWISLW